MKRSGKKTALTAAVCVLCVLLIAAGAGKIWLDFRRGNPNQKLYGREILLSSEMSPQEREIDFAELCVFLEKNAPVVNSFYYTEYASLNPDGTDNGVYGTAPDILLKADSESYFIRERLRKQGEDIYSLENRIEWDGVLRQTYELIKEQN